MSARAKLPIDPATGAPLQPRAQPGYYPGYHVMSQAAYWDEATRKVVTERVEQIPPIRFFNEEEARLMEAVFDRLLPQDDRDEAHRIPLLHYVDERLHLGVRDGYRYDGMPDDDEAYRLGMEGIEAMATELHGGAFAGLGLREQEALLKSLHDNTPLAGEAIWERMPAHRFFLMLLGDAVGAYYAHPWAWDEIGFGGPAYPRGYMRLERGEPEPWEVAEQRYAWAPPPDTYSAGFEDVGGEAALLCAPGQGGTH